MALEKATLSNGLSIQVDYADDATTNSTSVFVPYGSVSEKPGQEGIAHALEHCLDLQTEQFPDMYAFDLYCRLNHMKTESTTTHLRTGYHVVGRDLEPSMVRLSQIVQHATLSPEWVEREMKAVRREAVMSLDEIDEMHDLALAHAMFKGAYGRSIAGYSDRLDYDSDDLRKIYKRYYKLGRMTLVSTGNAPLNEVATLAEQYFQSDERWSLPYRYPETQKTSTKPAATTGLIYRDAKNAKIGISYIANPQLQRAYSEDPTAFSVAINVISDACFYKLRYDKGISYDGKAELTSPGPREIWTMRGSVTVACEEVEKAMHAFGSVFARTSKDYSDADICGALRQYEFSQLDHTEPDVEGTAQAHKYNSRSSKELSAVRHEAVTRRENRLITDVRWAIDQIAANAQLAERRVHITGSTRATRCADYIIQLSDIA